MDLYFVIWVSLQYNITSTIREIPIDLVGSHRHQVTITIQLFFAIPNSSYNHFLDATHVPEYLQHSWIVQNYNDDVEAIKAFLNTTVDTSQLEEMRKASSLVEAPNIDKKPDEDALKREIL